jgi:hypothetical protein
MRVSTLTLCAALSAAIAAPGSDPWVARAQTPQGSAPGAAQSDLATSLPAPPATDDIQTLLLDARQSLQAGRTREAQEALERAETRALDRSVPAGAEREVATGPVVRAAGAARQALAAGNVAGAIGIIDAALPSAATADIPK